MYAQAAAPDSEGVFNELARYPAVAGMANGNRSGAADLAVAR
jgi:hypothetical protein